MNILKKVMSVVLSGMIVLSGMSVTVFAASSQGESFSKIWDTPTNEVFDSHTDDEISTKNNGRIWTDKSVSGDSLHFLDKHNNEISDSILDVTADGKEFIESLSVMAQKYVTTITESKYKQANIVFIIDASTSMNKNYVDSEHKISRLEILKSVAKEFVATLVALSDRGYNVNLSIVTYSGSATTVLDWTQLSANVVSTIENTINNKTSNVYNQDGGNTDSMAGVALANYMFSDECNTQPENVNDSGTNNYIVFMSDGAPNRYYQKMNANGTYATDVAETVPITTFSKNGTVYKSTAVKTNCISRTITSTDYVKNAAIGTLQEVAKSQYINNMTMYTLGLGQWFTVDAAESGFATAPYLLQIAAALGNGKITYENAISYCGNDVPFYSMPGNNPSYPVLTYNNFRVGSGYAITTKTVQYATVADFEAGVLRYFGTEESRYVNGINSVGREVLRNAINYYAGNTAEKFQESITDIANSIISSMDNSITTATDPAVSGYVSFNDNIGQYMQVNEFRGIYFDGEIFTGASFAKEATSVDFTTSDELFLKLYEAFIHTAMAQYVTMDAFYDIVKGNIAAGLLYYNSDDDYSNCIKWYGSYDNNANTYYYVGNYYDVNGNVLIAPTEAEYICESWKCNGIIDSSSIIGENDMNIVYMESGVATRISDGKQSVHFEIPAALIPMRTVTVSNNIAITDDVKPVSLIFITGLVDNYIVSEDYEYYDDVTKENTFYSNRWNGTAPTETEIASAEYTPDKSNTYNYLQSDSPLYVSDGEVYVKATEADINSVMYYCEKYNTMSGEIVSYVPYNEYFKDPEICTGEDGYVYVKADACINNDNNSVNMKTENATSTLDFVHMEAITASENGLLSVTHYLGNNGKLIVMSIALELSKIWVDNNNSYNTRPNSIPVTLLCDGNVYSDLTLTTDNCTVNENEAGNTVWTYSVSGLPAGHEYVFTEGDVPFYTSSASVSDNKTVITNTVDPWFLDAVSVVFDFGIPISVDYFDKSHRIEYNDYDNISVTINNSDKLKYGDAYVDETNNIVYKSTTASCDGYDSIELMILVNGAAVNAKLNVIPATNVYYEESFAEFQSGKWMPTGAAIDKVQSDDNIVYGFDNAYAVNGNVADSLGTSMQTTVTSENTINTAEFVFTGNGFDLISRTAPDTGTVLVQVKSSADNVVKSYLVDTFLESNTLYQLPIVHCTDLDYDTYTVIIKAYYNKIFDHYLGTDNEGSANIYIDGFRVYNPLGSDTSAYDETVTELYTQANEINARYSQIRTLLINAKDWNESSGGYADGVIYIADGTTASKNDEWQSTGVYLSNAGNTYESKGPKNEVYLTNTHGVAFGIDENSNIQISAKSPEGKPVNILVYNVLADRWNVAATVTSSTEMYYDISDYISDGYAIIKCQAEDPTAILSLCQIKIVVPNENEVYTVTNSLIMTAYRAYSCAKVNNPSHVCDYNSAKTINEPTCTQKGVIRYICTVCDGFYDETVPALGHDYVNGKCIVCGEKDEKHIHSYTWIVVEDASCETDGVIEYSCACGSIAHEIIPATCHNYENGKCTVCGKSDPNFEDITVLPDIDNSEDLTEDTPDDTAGFEFVASLKQFIKSIVDFFNNIMISFSSMFNK